jgi:hypothetical protein
MAVQCSCPMTALAVMHRHHHHKHEDITEVMHVGVHIYTQLYFEHRQRGWPLAVSSSCDSMLALESVEF